jgi:hypothetical protein
MKKKVVAAAVLVIWLLLISIFMLLARHIDIEIFFVLWLIGILVVVEMIDARYSEPVYLRQVKMLVAGGIIVFGMIVAQKVMEILAK